jgi:GrpB-like predicted nucleotidyltransferase (UPF0157 family)
MIGGSETGIIRIVEYDPQWVRRFEDHRARIERALGSTASLIEHIGSTAVPGLAAKPIVDILAAVPSVDDEDSYRPTLEDAGYELRVREPGHRMFKTPARDVHLHLWDASGEIERHLRFRDWLRQNAPDRQLYERTKRELAKLTWSDSNEYAEAKTEVISQILARAARGTP